MTPRTSPRTTLSRTRRAISFAVVVVIINVSGCREIGWIGGILSRGSSESSYYPMVNSAGASSKSSQHSSGNTPKDVAHRYRDDVCAYTAAAAHRSKSREAFLRGLGEVAAAYGLTDWERIQSTYVGIGCGIVRGKLDQGDARGFVAALVGNDAERLHAIAWGIHEEQYGASSAQSQAAPGQPAHQPPPRRKR